MVRAKEQVFMDLIYWLAIIKISKDMKPYVKQEQALVMKI